MLTLKYIFNGKIIKEKEVKDFNSPSISKKGDTLQIDNTTYKVSDFSLLDTSVIYLLQNQ